ncbi:MAG: DegT/DnrJ/EryC1/StrS family aminotransferase, partial [Verrucomicrobiota bacterium]
IDPATFNLAPAALEAAITPRTRAVIPVHFAGLPCEMEAIGNIAQRHGLHVIEDAAHAHGAKYNHQPAGSLGAQASFSFQSSKNMTSGEGGIITTNDDALAEACRSIHNCGRIPTGVWYEHHVIAGNYRLGEFQGAVLNAQLDRLEEQTNARNQNGQHLSTCLGQLPGVLPQKRGAECTRHSYHLFMLRLDEARFGAPRAAVIRALQAEGIPCSAGYGFSLPQQPMFRHKAFGPYLPERRAAVDYNQVRCPNSDLLCREAIWFEHRMLLGSRDDASDIYRAFSKVYDSREALGDWARRQPGLMPSH